MPVLEINQRRVRLTNLDRILWPEQSYTKHDLIRYYIEVAPFLLPHLQNRPLVVQRFPGGINGEAFYQKNVPEGAPEWLHTIAIKHRDGKETRYVVAANVETLVWLGNQACLELHPWLSSIGSLEKPDFAVFDLDPMEKTTSGQIREVALTVREVLLHFNLESFPKLSGASGLQIYVPLEPLYAYGQVRRFVEAVCAQVHRLLPAITTLERKVEQRGGKLYLDYLQNGRGKTLAAPYSPRPLPGAPVSMPLSWEEVAAWKIKPGDFSIKNTPALLRERGDLFAAVLDLKQKLPSI